MVISWTNPYPSIIQLNVQRSYDSLRNFSTIFSPPSPDLPVNGYSEKKPPTNRVYYRIFYVFKGGSYFFTKAKRASGSAGSNAVTSRDDVSSNLKNIDPNDNRMVSIQVGSTVVKQIPAYLFPAFRDSILKQTKDTLFSINDTLVGINPFIEKEYWKPSQYVFTNKDGYIHIWVPDLGNHKYSIKFFEDNGTSLFEIANVKESPLTLDKANFVHAGWFLFELYEDNRLKEKNKFYLPKDF